MADVCYIGSVIYMGCLESYIVLRYSLWLVRFLYKRQTVQGEKNTMMLIRSQKHCLARGLVSPVAQRNRDKSRTSTKFGTNVLMGIQTKFRRGTTWSELPGGNGTQFNFCGPFSAWKRGWRIFMYLYTRFSRKCYVKLWHKSSYGPVRQIEKGFHVIRYSGGVKRNWVNFGGLFSAWKRGWRIFMQLYARFSRKWYVKLWHKSSYGHAKQIEKGCNVIRYFGRGDGTQYNFWGSLSPWKRIIMYLYMRLSRKS